MKLFKIIRTNFDKYIAASQCSLEKGLVASDFTDLNRDLIKKCFKKRGKGFILKYLSNDLRSDREIVLEAVKSDGLALEFASMELQLDEEIVKAAISENGSALDFASDELKSKKSLKLLAIPRILKGMPNCIIQDTDREVILQAVKHHPHLLETVRKEFKSDREIVLQAVTINGKMLEYASRELQSDRELVVLALYSYSKTNVPPELNSDKEIILARFCQRLISFFEVPNELKYDKDFILRALKKRYFKEFLTQIPKEMFRDSDIALFILKEVKQHDLKKEYLEHIKRDEKHWLLEFLK